MKSFLPNSDIETYPTHNEGISFIVKRLIKTLKK